MAKREPAIALVHCDVTAIRLRLKSCAWVALVAMFGLVLGPSISRALAANPASTFAAHAGHHAMGPHSHLSMGHAAAHHPQPDAPGRAPDGLDCCELCVVASTPLAIAVFAIPELRSVELRASAGASRALRAAGAARGLVERGAARPAADRLKASRR